MALVSFIRASQSGSVGFKTSIPLLIQSNRLYSTQSTGQGNAITTWDDYFKLRTKRRRYEIASYVPSTLIPMVGTGAYFMQLEISPMTTIMGMDPLIGSVVCTFGAGFLGFLMGPVFGDVLFKLTNRRYVPAMEVRDKILYEHIKKNRSSARLNSIRNPVPDYYGEKINSVAAYRSWLRKQREHYRKGVFGGKDEEL